MFWMLWAIQQCIPARIYEWVTGSAAFRKCIESRRRAFLFNTLPSLFQRLQDQILAGRRRLELYKGRHLDFLVRYEGMKIRHRSGVSHRNGDAVNRRPEGRTDLEMKNVLGKTAQFLGAG